MNHSDCLYDYSQFYDNDSKTLNTVNSEIFARTLFSRNFALHMRSFMKIKPSRNGKIILLFIDIGKSCLNREFYHITNMSFNDIRENKILAKISESTVSVSFSMI